MGETLNQNSVAEADFFFDRIALEGLLLQAGKDFCLCAVVADGNECLFCLRRDEMVRIGRSFKQGCHHSVDVLINIPWWEFCKHERQCHACVLRHL